MRVFKELAVFGVVLIAIFVGSYAIEQYFGLSDPIKVLYFWSGWLSFGSLVLGLIAGRWGRALGHCALAFAILHLGIFVYFDFDFDWDLMAIEILQKNYIVLGLLGFVGMLILGYFSFSRRFYRILFWLVLICIGSALLHIVQIQKVLSWEYWAVILACFAIIAFKLKKRAFGH